MPIRVLHMIHSNKLFGAERIILELIKKMNSYKNYEFGLFHMSGNEDFTKIFSQVCKVYVFQSLKSSTYEFIKCIIDFKPHIIHAHDFRMSTLAAIFSKVFLKKVPIICTIHHNPPWLSRDFILRMIAQWALERCTKITAVSSVVAKSISFSKRIENNTVVLPNPYLGTPSLENERLEEKRYDALFVGRLVEKKNPDVFVKACKMFDGKFLCLGDGPLKDKLISMADGKVEFVGTVSNPEKYMAESKCLVLPSKYEGFGLVVLEAMANYCIPIVTRCGGPEDFVVEGYNGFFVSEDVVEVAEKMKFVLNNYQNLIEEMKLNMKDTVQKYSLESYAIKLDNVYKELLGPEPKIEKL